MAKKEYIVIGIDPGLSGGIVVFEKNNDTPIVNPIPITTTIVNNKKKNVYDLEKIVDILKKYKKNVILGIEKQGVRHGEGSVSSFTAGEGYGSLKGIAIALGFKVIIIQSTSWKKQFTELNNGKMEQLKEENKKMRVEIKDIKKEIILLKENNKNTKDKNIKLQNTKDIKEKNKLIKTKKKELISNNIKVKHEAKKNSRLLCQKLYPQLEDEFTQVKNDGKADALLIGLYVKKNLNELV